jgi:hypothetical protein
VKPPPASGGWHWVWFRRDPAALLRAAELSNGPVFLLRLGFRPTTVLIGPSFDPAAAMESIHRLRYRLGHSGVIDVADTLGPLIIDLATQTLPANSVAGWRVLIGKGEALDLALLARQLTFVAAGTVTKAMSHHGFDIERGARLMIAPPPETFIRPALKVILTMLLRDFDLRLVDTWRVRVRYRRLLA